MSTWREFTRGLGRLIYLAAGLVAMLPIFAGAEPSIEELGDLLRDIVSANEESEQFSLFNECRPLDFLVNLQSEKSSGLGLTETGLRAAAESRLRGARLYDQTAPDYLSLQVTALPVESENGRSLGGHAVTLSLELRRRLCWEEDHSVCAWGAVWEDAELYLVPGNDSGFVMERFREIFERFLADYLRRNEDACE